METGGSDTRQRILDAAETLLHRYGPAKTRVVDVARLLGMSHGNVYRHFSSKAALQDAVAQRWLHEVAEPLAAIAAGPGPAPERLETWLWTLIAAKRDKVSHDPEMFATYHALAEQSRAVVEAHVDDLRGQIATIISDGVRDGSFAVSNPQMAARAALNATLPFHHPHFLQEKLLRSSDDDAAAAIRLVIGGLCCGAL